MLLQYFIFLSIGFTFSLFKCCTGQNFFPLQTSLYRSQKDLAKENVDFSVSQFLSFFSFRNCNRSCLDCWRRATSVISSTIRTENARSGTCPRRSAILDLAASSRAPRTTFHRLFCHRLRNRQDYFVCVVLMKF